jgi:hypothetical protein
MITACLKQTPGVEVAVSFRQMLVNGILWTPIAT